VIVIDVVPTAIDWSSVYYSVVVINVLSILILLLLELKRLNYNLYRSLDGMGQNEVSKRQ
jgi:hypothetical protein